MAQRPWENDPIVKSAAAVRSAPASDARGAVEFAAPVDPMSPAEAERLQLAKEAEARAGRAETRAIIRDEMQMNKPTQEQGQAGFLISRIKGGINDIESVINRNPEAQSPGFAESVRGGLDPTGISGIAVRGMTEPQRRMVADAQSDMLDALLTLATGAAYTKEQLAGQLTSYFPQYGDTPEEIQMKNNRVARAVEAAKLRAGPLADQLDGIADQFKAIGPPQADDGRIVKAPPGTAPGVVMGAMQGGEPVLTPKDMTDRAALQQAWDASNGNPEAVKQAAASVGRMITPELDQFMRDNAGQRVQLQVTPTGTPTATQEAVGEFVATPLGEMLAAGAVGGGNAATFGMLDELAPILGLDAQRVQMAKDYLRDKAPVSSFAGEMVGSFPAVIGANAGAGALLAGSRFAARAPMLGDVAFGGAYGAGEQPTGSDFTDRLGGAALGAGIGAGVGAAARRVFGRSGGGASGGGSATPDGGVGGDGTAIIRTDDVFRGNGTPRITVTQTDKPFVVRSTGVDQVEDMVISGLVRPKPGGYGANNTAQLYFGEADSQVPTSIFSRPGNGKVTIVGESEKLVGKDGPIPIDQLKHVWAERDGNLVDILPDILARNRAMGGMGGATAASGARSSVSAAATPDDLIRASKAAELGIDLMPFQASRSFKDMQRAHELAKNGEIGGPLRERFGKQQVAIAQKFDDFIESTESEIRENLRGQGAKVTTALEKMAAKDKTKVRTLYNQAAKSADAETPVPLSDRVTIMQDGDDIDTTLIEWLNDQPSNVATSGITDSAKQFAARLGIAKIDPKTKELIPSTPTVKGMERLRREISQVADGGDKDLIRQKTVLKKLIDEHTEPYATGAYAKARAARREVAEKYENVSTIAQLLGTKRNTPERVVAAENVMERLISGNTSVENLQALRKLTTGEGGDPQAWKEVQGATLEYLRGKAYGAGNNVDEFGNPVIQVAQFRNAVADLDKSGKLEELLGFEKASSVRVMADVARDMFTAPAGSVNFANTNSMWWNIADMLLNGALFQIPLPAGVASSVLAPLKRAVKEAPLKKEVKQLIGEPTQ